MATEFSRAMENVERFTEGVDRIDSVDNPEQKFYAIQKLREDLAVLMLQQSKFQQQSIWPIDVSQH